MNQFGKKTLIFLSVAMLFNACSKEEEQKRQNAPSTR